MKIRSPKEFIETAIKDVGFGKRNAFKHVLESHLEKMNNGEELLGIVLDRGQVSNHMMVTNKRVINVEIHGFRREESYIFLKDIRNIDFNRGIIRSSISVIGSNLENMVIKEVRSDVAEEFRALIEEQRGQFY